MVPPWDAKAVAADPPQLGLGLGLGLEPELRPEFFPPPSRTRDNFPMIQRSYGAKHHLPASIGPEDDPERPLMVGYSIHHSPGQLTSSEANPCSFVPASAETIDRKATAVKRRGTLS